MSIEVMTLVWKSGAYEGGALLTLLALANWASDDGTRVFPRIQQVMEKTRLTERGARYCMKQLKDDQVIILIKKADGTRGMANEWKIDLDRLKQVGFKHQEARGQIEAGGQIEAVTGANGGSHGGKCQPFPQTPYIDSTVIQPSRQPSSAPNGAADKPKAKKKRKEVPPEFDEFYDNFPRHVGRGQAERAYIQALKYATPLALLEGAQRYALERLHQDPEYTKHPSTWLNGKCWLDDAAAPKANGNGQPIFEQAPVHGWVKRLECYYGYAVTDDPDTSVDKGTWLKTWGPRPETIGCKVPDEAYDQFRQQRRRA